MANERSSDVTRLPRGATGFRDHGTEPLQVTDARAFASACYEAARLVRGKVLEITPPVVTPNFHTAVMKCGESTVGVLGRVHLPVVAIAEVPTGDVVFVDSPHGLEKALRASGTFRLLTRDELETPIGLIDTSDLDAAERREIAYWKPAILGQLLFNYWD
ncbi:hypothetical protein FDA94_03385 [Herbidospora galbida]|uniref:Uncharacterized protein n=1 Tax=Herbidospora galbida TaxID=2575442 RepID=A0A4U3MMS3_9ACTN|nr:hypothetical protein [Herbidospora galbida]TKK90821.1 hypothetical protein FDA94_03385 [Herbidospora galbida]